MDDIQKFDCSGNEIPDFLWKVSLFIIITFIILFVRPQMSTMVYRLRGRWMSFIFIFIFYNLTYADFQCMQIKLRLFGNFGMTVKRKVIIRVSNWYFRSGFGFSNLSFVFSNHECSSQSSISHVTWFLCHSQSLIPHFSKIKNNLHSEI